MSDINVWDAVMHEVLLDEVEKEPSTEPGLQKAAETLAAMQELIAAERRSMVPDAPPPTRMEPIRASLLRMTRDELITKVKELLGASHSLSVQLAYRDATHQSAHDLRVLVMALESVQRTRP
jgi:hypothetical protein